MLKATPKDNIVKFDQHELYTAVKNLINNQELCAKFNGNLRRKNVNMISGINKIYKLFKLSER